MSLSGFSVSVALSSDDSGDDAPAASSSLASASNEDAQALKQAGEEDSEVRRLATEHADRGWREEYPIGWPEYLAAEEIRHRLKKRGLRFDPSQKLDKCTLLRHMYTMLDQIEREKRCFCLLHVVLHCCERLPEPALCGSRQLCVRAALWPGGETKRTQCVRGGSTSSPCWDAAGREAGVAAAARSAEKAATGPVFAPDGTAAGDAGACAGCTATRSPSASATSATSSSSAIRPPNHLVWKLPFRPARSELHYLELDVMQEGISCCRNPVLGRSGKLRLHKLIRERGAGGSGAEAAPDPAVWVRLHQGRGKLQCTAYYEFVPRQPGEKFSAPHSLPARKFRSDSNRRKKQLGWQPPPLSTTVAYWGILLLSLFTVAWLLYVVLAQPTQMQTIVSTLRTVFGKRHGSGHAPGHGGGGDEL